MWPSWIAIFTVIQFWGSTYPLLELIKRTTEKGMCFGKPQRNIFAQGTSTAFPKNFKNFANFSKLLNIFSSLFFVPLKDLLRHILQNFTKTIKNTMFFIGFQRFSDVEKVLYTKLFFDKISSLTLCYPRSYDKNFFFL